MKQETGNNITLAENKVSIQLPLGGHSFSLQQLDEACRDARIEHAVCTVLTPRTTLVPSEWFDDGAAEQYLRVTGLPCRSDETVVTSDVSAEAVAVMAVNAECVKALRERFGEGVTFVSPLCGSREYQQPTVWLYGAQDIIYIKVYRPDLKLAEAVEISSDADVLQLLHDLEAAYEISSCRIVCSGEDCERLRRRLAKYYPDVRCES